MKRGVAASAFAFVMTMGPVNLFADVTYEGGASINGPFLGTLGASAATISIVAGAGEFLGYSPSNSFRKNESAGCAAQRNSRS